MIPFTLCLHVCARRAGKDTLWYRAGDKKPLRPRRCSISQPMLIWMKTCATLLSGSAPGRRPVRRDRPAGGAVECEGKRTRLGRRSKVGEPPSLRGLRRLFSQAPWVQEALVAIWLQQKASSNASSSQNVEAAGNTSCDRGGFDHEQAERAQEGRRGARTLCSADRRCPLASQRSRQAEVCEAEALAFQSKIEVMEMRESCSCATGLWHAAREPHHGSPEQPLAARP